MRVDFVALAVDQQGKQFTAVVDGIERDAMLSVPELYTEVAVLAGNLGLNQAIADGERKRSRHELGGRRVSGHCRPPRQPRWL